MNKLKKMLAVMLCLGASMAAMADDAMSLIVTTKNAKVAYAFSTKPVVTFTATDVVIKTSEVEVSYPLADHVQFSFSENAVGIGQVKEVNAVIDCTGNAIGISNAEPNMPVAIYTVDGKLVKSATTSGEGKAVLPIEATGVLVVKVGQMTMKITK